MDHGIGCQTLTVSRMSESAATNRRYQKQGEHLPTRRLVGRGLEHGAVIHGGPLVLWHAEAIYREVTLERARESSSGRDP